MEAPTPTCMAGAASSKLFILSAYGLVVGVNSGRIWSTCGQRLAMTVVNQVTWRRWAFLNSCCQSWGIFVTIFFCRLEKVEVEEGSLPKKSCFIDST